MNQPLISVVMINYNAGRLLNLAIDSILQQTDIDLELIIVDDFSKDDGPDVIRSYAAKDSRVKPLISAVNRGISGTRNAGIEIARGEFIALLDGDDQHLPNTLSKQLSHFIRLRESYPDLCLLASDAWLINQAGERGGRYMPTTYWSGDHITDCPRWTVPSGWFFPRECPVRFHPGYRFSDAPIFINRMAEFGTIAYVGEPLIEYRLRISSATNALAARLVRDLNASALSLIKGCLNDPVPSDSLPDPSWSQVAAFKYGRNAKAAALNHKPFRAAKDLCVATIADPAKAFGKMGRFLGQKLKRP